LTAMLQLRRRNDSLRQRWGRNPDIGEVEDPVRSWWSLDRSSSAPGLPVVAFSTTHRDRGATSDALCHSHRKTGSFDPAFDTPPGSVSSSAPSRAVDSTTPGRLSSTSATSSVPACAGQNFRFGHRDRLGFRLTRFWARDHREPAAGPRCLHREPAFDILSPPVRKARRPDPNEFLRVLAARASIAAWTGCRSSNSATSTTREHNRRTA